MVSRWCDVRPGRDIEKMLLFGFGNSLGVYHLENVRTGAVLLPIETNKTCRVYQTDKGPIRHVFGIVRGVLKRSIDLRQLEYSIRNRFDAVGNERG